MNNISLSLKQLSTLLTAFLFCVMTSPGIAAELIPVGTGDLNVIGSSLPEMGRDEDNLVNGSGLGVDIITSNLIVNTGQPNGNNWNTETSTADITFDLGSVFNIDFLQIWNFNDSFGNNDFGASSIDLLVSNVGTNAQNADFTGSMVLATLLINEATGSLRYFGENYRFNGKMASDIPEELGGDFNDFSDVNVQGRFVRLANLDGSDSFGGRTGLSEVRFYGTPVPLPGAVWLLGSAMIGLFAISRKKERNHLNL